MTLSIYRDTLRGMEKTQQKRRRGGQPKPEGEVRGRVVHARVTAAAYADLTQAAARAGCRVSDVVRAGADAQARAILEDPPPGADETGA